MKRSAAALLLFPPKYLSRHHKFNYIYDTIDNSDKPIIRSFFIYNQPGGLTSANGGMRGMSGNKGIACILYDIYSNKNNDSINNMYAYPTNPELFEKRIQTTFIGDNVNSIAGYSGYSKCTLSYYLLICIYKVYCQVQSQQFIINVFIISVYLIEHISIIGIIIRIIFLNLNFKL